jgi:hypothetical protein
VQLIANRLPVGDGQREQVEDAMHERLDIRPLASFSEGDQIHFDVSPLQGIRPSMEGNSTRRVLRKAAAATSRRIATAITAGANQIGEVEQALADTAEPQVGFGSIGTSTWEQARTELVRASVDLADGYDMSVERSAGNDLAVRIRRSLGPLDSAGIADELDEWRTRATQSMVDVARFGIRRTSGLRIVEQHAWIAAVNGDFARPKRFDKMVRSAGNEITSKARNDLIEILESPAKSRRDQWHGTLQDIGSFRPGELLVAADAVFQSEAGDG